MGLRIPTGRRQTSWLFTSVVAREFELGTIQNKSSKRSGRVKATSFSSVVVNIASSVQKVSYSKPLHNESRCLNTMKSFLAFSHQHLDIRVLSKRLHYDTSAKHPGEGHPTRI